jgi:hypothetical protein
MTPTFLTFFFAAKTDPNLEILKAFLYCDISKKAAPFHKYRKLILLLVNGKVF